MCTNRKYRTFFPLRIRMCSMFNVAQKQENNAKIVLPEKKKKQFLITGLAILIKAPSLDF